MALQPLIYLLRQWAIPQKIVNRIDCKPFLKKDIPSFHFACLLIGEIHVERAAKGDGEMGSTLFAESRIGE